MILDLVILGVILLTFGGLGYLVARGLAGEAAESGDAE